jgi:hypothetical protein
MQEENESINSSRSPLLEETSSTSFVQSRSSDYSTFGLSNTATMSKKNDPMIRDKKQLPLSDFGTSVIAFLGSIFIIVPLWFTLLLPLTVAWQTVSFGKKLIEKVTSKGDKNGSTSKQEDPKALIGKIEKTNTAIADRQFDLVLMGATGACFLSSCFCLVLLCGIGFTGRLAAIYLAKQYGTSVKWAIAGRRRDALEKVRSELLKYNKDLHDLPIVIADSYNEDTLNTMTAATKVVITTAGPFSKYGTALVKSCARK